MNHDKLVFKIREYQNPDLDAVRIIYGNDEFARPRLLRKYPRMREFLADEASLYYTRYEPENILVSEVSGEVVGALLGGIDTQRHARFYKRRIRPYLVLRCLMGEYGWPAWLSAVIRTELACRQIESPQIDINQYPAHLHIGVLPAWRRKGMGTALMDKYAKHLHRKGVAGYHLYASSFHPLGLSFYRKLRLECLGQFEWRLYDGFEWLMVTEYIFGLRLN